MTPRLDDKAILVAGAPGAAVVTIGETAAARGARVVLCAPSGFSVPERQQVYALTGDLADEAAVEALFDAALEQLPTLDALVCLVPVAAVPPLLDLSLQAWNEQVVDPLRIPFFFGRRAVEEFLSTDVPGRIVLVIGWPGPSDDDLEIEESVTEDVLQSALLGFARSVAKEYGRRGVTCNLVVPRRPRVGGQITHPGLDEESSSRAASDWTTLVVESVLFLAGEEASFVNGDVLTVAPSERDRRSHSADRGS